MSQGYRRLQLPEGARRSWQALYAGTAKLTSDLMEHIHLENYILLQDMRRRARKDECRLVSVLAGPRLAAGSLVAHGL